MCGLFGIAGPGIVQADVAAFVDMGIASQVRGRDAAGIFQTNTRAGSKNHLEDGYKSNGTLLEVLDDIEISRKMHPHLLNTISVDVLMGHVRARTRGANIQANAHPFYTKSLVGMHNGTLVDQKYTHVNKTDSEMMFLEMEWRGIVPTLTELSPNSAYAVSIYVRERKELVFATNGQRPLWFVNLKDRGVMYWASEAAILRFALDRRGISYYKPYPMPVDLVARLDPRKISSKSSVDAWTKIAEIEKKKELPKAVIDTMKLFEASTTVTQTDIPVVKNNVLSFPEQPLTIPKEFTVETKNRKRIPIKEFYTLKCNCGKTRLNLFQARLCRRGDAGSPPYNSETDTFTCPECTTIEKSAKC